MTLIHIPLHKICQNLKDEDSKLGFTLIYQFKKFIHSLYYFIILVTPRNWSWHPNMSWCYNGKIVLNCPDIKISKKSPPSDSLVSCGAKSIVDIPIHLIHFSDLWDRDQVWVALTKRTLWSWHVVRRANWNSIHTASGRTIGSLSTHKRRDQRRHIHSQQRDRRAACVPRDRKTKAATPATVPITHSIAYLSFVSGRWHSLT